MEKILKKELDNLIDNWDLNVEKSYEYFSKIQNWSCDRLVEIKQHYDKKISKLDLFEKLNFSNLYNCEKSGNILMLKFLISKDEQKRTAFENGQISSVDTKYSVSTYILLKVTQENEGAEDVNYLNEKYKMINIANLMNYSFRNYQNFNIDNLHQLISEIDLEKIKLTSLDEFQIECYIPQIRSYNKYNDSITLDDNNQLDNQVYKSYNEHKKKSAKKFDLIEIFRKKIK